MTTDVPPANPEARVGELATGFALGELEEAELKELYDLLREDGGRGADAARVCWQTLGMVTDLRAEVGSAFQDTVRHRLGAERSGRFTARLLGRLGFRGLGLQPVETPEPSGELRRALWILVGAAAAVTLVALLVWILADGHGGRASVVALRGAATIAGEPLVPGGLVDHRTLVVKPGGQVTLTLGDGSSATIAGGDEPGSEAVATLRRNGMALLRGRAWITARSGFTLALPDRSCSALADDTALAAELSDGRGFVGVRRGELRVDRLDHPLGENQAAGPAGTHAWRWEWDASGGTVGPGQPAPSDWLLLAEVTWTDPADSAALRFLGEAGDDVELRLAPGAVAVAVGGKEVQRVALGGSPLLAIHLGVRQRDRKQLAVSANDIALTIPLGAGLNRYRLAAEGGMVRVDTFHPLPTPRPPYPVAGW
jgi:hypothetical protein